MFTSRAEFRLRLRIDNADERLTPEGRRIGLVSDDRWSRFLSKEAQKKDLRDYFERNPAATAKLRRPECQISDIDGLTWPTERWIAGVTDTVQTEIKYAGYIAQQQRQIEQLRSSERRPIPFDFCYSEIPGLSREVMEKLEKYRPETLGQAARIGGVTPAAVAVLEVYLSVGR
jgi:tRNA uridine 5-carboxymethylaminomethyl modification enzyme